MDSIKNHLEKFLKNKKNPTSERAYLIQTICDSIFDDQDFKKILGQTRNLTVEEIRDIYDEAYRWKVNPQALFWKLLKKKHMSIKKKMESISKDTALND